MERTYLSPLASTASSGTGRGAAAKKLAVPCSVVDVYQRQGAAFSRRCSLRQMRLNTGARTCRRRTSTTYQTPCASSTFATALQLLDVLAEYARSTPKAAWYT